MKSLESEDTSELPACFTALKILMLHRCNTARIKDEGGTLMKTPSLIFTVLFYIVVVIDLSTTLERCRSSLTLSLIS